MVKNFKKNYTKSSRNRKLWKRFQGLDLRIKNTVYGISTGALITFFAAGGTTWLAKHYQNLQAYWQTRSEIIERKIAEVGAVYLPLEKNSNKIDSDSTKAINVNGLATVTGKPFSEWTLPLNESLGEIADSLYTQMKMNHSIKNSEIGYFVVQPDSDRAYIAVLNRNGDNHLELIITPFQGYDKLKTSQEMALQSKAEAEDALKKRSEALAQRNAAEERATEKTRELTQVKTVLSAKETEMNAYKQQQQEVLKEYAALAQQYDFTSFNEDYSELNGFNRTLKGNIYYNISFEQTEDGLEKAIITHEIKDMSLVELQKNLTNLKKYMNLFMNIQKYTNQLNANKIRPWIPGIKTVITPVPEGLQVDIIYNGEIKTQRTSLEYMPGSLEQTLGR